MANVLYARIQGYQDIDVSDCSVEFNMDESNSFSFSLPAKRIDWINLLNREVEIYDGDELIISGIIIKSPKLKINKEKVIMVKLNSMGEFGKLSCISAKNNAHYQDQILLTVLNDLISVTAGAWVVNLNNMDDVLATVTVDLRSKETLFAQIIELSKAIPKTHIRYGGKQPTGEYIIEIGNFNDVTHRAIQHGNLIDIKLQHNSNRIYNIVESYGDVSSDEKIGLNRALNDARTIVHPDYAQFPITQNVLTGGWECTNNILFYGCSIKKNFNVIKTKNDEPVSDTQKNEAGYALWRKTVRFMQRTEPYLTFTGSAYFDTTPKVGDRMYIKSIIKEPIYDELTGKIVTYHETLNVAEDFRITNVSTDFEQADVIDQEGAVMMRRQVKYDFELTSNDESEELDADVQLFERLEPHNGFDTSGALGFDPVQTTVVTHDSTDAADCAGSAPGTGKTFFHASPAVPVWATSVVTWYVADPGDMEFYNLSLPTNPGDDWSVCIEPKGVATFWPPPAGVTYTITVFWQFYA